MMNRVVVIAALVAVLVPVRAFTDWKLIPSGALEAHSENVELYGRLVQATLRVDAERVVLFAPGAVGLTIVSPRVILDGVEVLGVGISKLDPMTVVLDVSLDRLAAARRVSVGLAFRQSGELLFHFVVGGHPSFAGFIAARDAKREAKSAAQTASQDRALAAERRKVVADSLASACEPTLKRSAAEPHFQKAYETATAELFFPRRGSGMLRGAITEEELRDLVEPHAACVLHAAQRNKRSFAARLAPFAEGVRPTLADVR
jgi:hypothetical protein